jgi:hypothetical protein
MAGVLVASVPFPPLRERPCWRSATIATVLGRCFWRCSIPYCSDSTVQKSCLAPRSAQHRAPQGLNGYFSRRIQVELSWKLARTLALPDTSPCAKEAGKGGGGDLNKVPVSAPPGRG